MRVSVQSRISALEKRAHGDLPRVSIITIYPDDYEGELGPFDYRKSEVPPIDSMPRVDVRYIMDFSGSRDADSVAKMHDD
jgi:hypothetical protein